MRRPRLKFPKLCLSTILIETGIICALVAVNTRPMSYGMGNVSAVQPVNLPRLGNSQNGPSSKKARFVFDGEETKVIDDIVMIEYSYTSTDDTVYEGIRVANYGWPLKSVEIASDTHEVHYVDKQRLAANIAICLAIIVCSAIAIEWSVRYAQRKQKSRAIAE